eukprot:Clim_evm111s128 gene=Clim_evmTU111s128
MTDGAVKNKKKKDHGGDQNVAKGNKNGNSKGHKNNRPKSAGVSQNGELKTPNRKASPNPRTPSPTLYASGKSSEAPHPSQLPLPPQHWLSLPLRT